MFPGEQTSASQAAASSSNEQAPNALPDLPLEQPGKAQDPEAAAAPAASHEPGTGGMSLQPPSLPLHFLQQQQQQQQGVAAPGACSGQAQQQASSAAPAAGASPREVGQLGVAGQKQAPKPPLAPGSKSTPQV